MRHPHFPAMSLKNMEEKHRTDQVLQKPDNLTCFLQDSGCQLTTSRGVGMMHHNIPV
jgi:hypothetical protein